MSRYPYENPQSPVRLRDRDDIEQRALKIAHSEGRTEITLLDRIRAERELHLPESGA